ncbi:MAG: hypothetical protein AB7K36_23560, partial [Chloroflexota bacterium]
MRDAVLVPDADADHDEPSVAQPYGRQEARRAAGPLPLPRAAGDWLLQAAPFLLALLVYGAAYVRMEPTPTGDEPHYILYSHSLVFDGDADLANNYDRATVQWYFPYYDQLDPHGREYLGDGSLHSIHYLGLPILISPIIAAGGGVATVRVLMLLLSALLAQQLFGLLADSRLARTGYVRLAWAATAFSLPLVTFSGQIYPELPAALVMVASLRVLVQARPSLRALVLVTMGAAVLPWLHFRFIVFAGGLSLGMIFQLARQAGWPVSVAGVLEHIRQPAAWVRFWPLLLPAASLMMMGLVTYRLYGSPLPMAMYAPELATLEPWSLAIAYRHGLGAILSPANGWLPYAPVHWLGLAGIIPLAVRFRRAAPAVLVFVGVYFMLVAGPVPVGNSLPARYIMTLIPLVAVPLLLVIGSSWPGRLLFVPLLGLSLVLMSLGVLHHTLLYQDENFAGSAALPLASRLQGIWPDFGANARPAAQTARPQFVVTAATAQHMVGRVVDGPAARVLYAAPGADEPGMLVFGPFTSLEPGSYLARFHVAASGNDPLARAATLDVMTDLPELFTELARRE